MFVFEREQTFNSKTDIQKPTSESDLSCHVMAQIFTELSVTRHPNTLMSQWRCLLKELSRKARVLSSYDFAESSWFTFSLREVFDRTDKDDVCHKLY